MQIVNTLDSAKNANELSAAPKRKNSRQASVSMKGSFIRIVSKYCGRVVSQQMMVQNTKVSAIKQKRGRMRAIDLLIKQNRLRALSII